MTKREGRSHLFHMFLSFLRTRPGAPHLGSGAAAKFTPFSLSAPPGPEAVRTWSLNIVSGHPVSCSASACPPPHGSAQLVTNNGTLGRLAGLGGPGPLSSTGWEEPARSVCAARLRALHRPSSLELRQMSSEPRRGEPPSCDCGLPADVQRAWRRGSPILRLWPPTHSVHRVSTGLCPGCWEGI